MVGRKPGDHSVGLFGIMRPLHHRRVGGNRLAALRHGLGKRVQRLVGSAADRHKRVRTALGRNAQFELANLKRSYKNEGMNEAAIHAIIPDRPVAKKAAKKADAEPTEAK